VRAELGVPFIPARRYVGRVVPLGVVVEVLAEEGGSVTILLEAGGDRALLAPLVSELLEAPDRALVAPHAVVVGVEAGEHGRPGGTTCWVAYKGFLEGGTPFGQQRVDLGHLLGGGEVQVIGEHEDYVGPVR